MSIMCQLKTQGAVRQSFWENHPQYTRKGNRRQNDYPCNVRVAWCDWVEYLHRAQIISDNLANSVTL